jgi:sec-independent protein translocase protein TatB
MLDIAWPEIIVIGAVALVAIGPKDLPKVMRVAGEWAGKARNAARELQRSFEQLSYEAEIADKLQHDEIGVSPPDAPTVKPSAETDRDRTGA